jgi:hypothetical protein
MLEHLKNLLGNHRENAFITCDPSCLCWEIEDIINEEESRLTPVSTDVRNASAQLVEIKWTEIQ